MTTTAHKDQFTPEPDPESECRKAREKALDVCVWTRLLGGDRDTQCGRLYEEGYDTLTPKEDGFDFCPFCGKKIKVEKETT